MTGIARLVIQIAPSFHYPAEKLEAELSFLYLKKLPAS